MAGLWVTAPGGTASWQQAQSDLAEGGNEDTACQSGPRSLGVEQLATITCCGTTGSVTVLPRRQRGDRISASTRRWPIGGLFGDIAGFHHLFVRIYHTIG
jgi:hypothetical protein